MKKKKSLIGDMSVKRKLLTFSIVMVILMIVIAGCGIWSSKNINRARSNRYNIYAMGEYYLSEAYSDFADIKVHLRNILYVYDMGSEDSQNSIEAITYYEERVQQSLDEFETRKDDFKNQEIPTEYDSIVTEMKAYIESANTAVAQVKEGSMEEAKAELLSTGVQTAKDVEEGLRNITEMVATESDADNEKVESELAAMMMILIVVSVVAVLITIGFCLVLVRSITVPVKKLSEAASKLAIGDIDVDCEKIYNDDLGELMDNFQHMANGIREQTRIADIISKGDFTVEVTPRSEDDVLGHALRKLVTDENMTLNNIKESGEQIAVGSEQVANASQALAQGATEQASALEEVTASMDEVTQRTKNNATEAGEANTLVNNIKDKAAEGNGQMKSMIEAMDSINESSETISKIIKTIDDIAFQTNILALNAAVEAARAGVHGKGFAVVAEEVRNLAAKSASAASETAEMIEDSIRKIANGTKLAEETASSLDEIVSSIDEIVSLISSITVSSSDQATAISQIDQAISQVSTVVQTNAATSEEAAAASEQLSNQAATLKGLISQYKLVALGQGASSFGDSGDSSYDDSEQIISLEGDFSKY